MVLHLFAALALQAPAPGLAATPSFPDSLRAALLEAEDMRATTPAQLDLLLRTARGTDPESARIAVRALGRLERVTVLSALGMALRHRYPAVRAEAAAAIGQTVSSHADSALAAYRLLMRTAADEQAPEVVGALLRTIGRLPIPADMPSAVEAELLLGVAATRQGDLTREAALRGLADLLRRRGPRHLVSPVVRDSLRSLVAHGTSVPIRRLALLALTANGNLDIASAAAALGDRDVEVRRLAVSVARTTTSDSLFVQLGVRGSLDPSYLVRYEALRALGAHLTRTDACSALHAFLGDPSPHVALLGIDLLADGCPATAAAATLDPIAAEPVSRSAWHAQAHAIVGLARADSTKARARLPGFVTSDIWWVRMYAARAVARMGDRALLRRLVADPVDNVREEALRQLVQLEGHAVDSLVAAQLGRPDYQLVLTAANSLKGAPSGAPFVRPLLEALARITLEQRETSRDPRLAILDRLGEFIPSSDAAALRPYLEDFDPAIARRAATILAPFSAEPVTPDPQPLPAIPPPSPDELRGMTRAVIVMADGGRIVLRLRPDLAPTNVARFVRMARAGTFDGRTLHRVVPNFVLQGGSPGANEYMGEALFTRDEVGGSHVRGTVGISTRGRDTGDGQVFFNLVDNLRLDGDYTLIAEVTEGLDVMDRILEGAVIARVEAGS